MIFDIPIYIEQRERGYLLKPLFFDEPYTVHRDLARGTERLTQLLRQHLRTLGREDRHDALLDCCFAPRLQTRKISLDVTVKKQTIALRLLAVMFEQFGRNVCLLPGIDAMWFTVSRAESITQRAAVVLTDRLKSAAEEAQASGEPFDLNGIAPHGGQWLSEVEAEVALPKKIGQQRTGAVNMAFLGSRGVQDGATALAKTGRRLNSLYPSDLQRAKGRDEQLEELSRALVGDRKRPILVLGPAKVGKTALIHQAVRRAISTGRESGRKSAQFWLLSPGRLIAGMSYVGQWEQRVLAITAHARKKGLVLIFDDYLGLYQAGRTSQSELSVADVLRPQLTRRELRLVVEMTDEQLRVFRELDRQVADQFHLIRLAPMTPAETTDIAIGALRELEGQYGCAFHPAALPVASELQRRFNRTQALPGKVISFLGQVAGKHPRAPIDVDTITADFAAATGLNLSFVDNRVVVKRTQIQEALAAQVIGQTAAIEALTDVILIGKTGLNDRGRPLASLLFLGPTGVGKTECAKAATAYLFGTEDRLLRFDLNEYADPGAVARLTGTFHRPSGLLTAGVRQRPFSVVLFDEIEKAHPDVFDMLLQVLDDGRLTDATGEVTDFSQTIIIMTANLGASESGKSVGFGRGQIGQAAVFTKAAERFFKPEFFNRIDRIVPFEPLTADQLHRIARLELRAALSRSGLTRRRHLLTIAPQVYDRIVALAADPRFGARALKRTIEQRLLRPIATRLSAVPATTAAVIAVTDRGERFSIQVRPLRQARRGPALREQLDTTDPQRLYARLEAAAVELRTVLDHRRSGTEINALVPSAEDHTYITIAEQLADIREGLAELGQWFEADSPTSRPIKVSGVYAVSHTIWDVKRIDLASALSYQQQLTELYQESRGESGRWHQPLLDLVRRTSAAWLMIETAVKAPQEMAQVAVRSIGEHRQNAVDLCRRLHDFYSQGCGFEVTEIDNHSQFAVTGPAALAIAGIERGTHLFEHEDGSFELAVVDVADRDRPAATEPADGLPDIVRIYDDGGTAFDLRNGMMVNRQTEPRQRPYELDRALSFECLPLAHQLRKADR